MEVTVSEMKKIEQEADARGLSYTKMMENAGTSAAMLLTKKSPKNFETVTVFCGTGNNGGDGFVLARVLKALNKKVKIVLVGGEPKTQDAILNYEKAKELEIPIYELGKLSLEEKNFILKADTVVDAIYGTGFHGELRPEGRKACDLINLAEGFAFSLDLPSGVNADTGICADGSVRADLTATFHASKPCHRLNATQCGNVEILSIGIENIKI